MAQQNLVAVTGNTYPVKDQLRAMGGRWDAARKVWMVPAEKSGEAQKLVAVAPVTKRSTGFRKYGFRRRNDDDECDMCGKNKWTCGHCIGW